MRGDENPTHETERADFPHKEHHCCSNEPRREIGGLQVDAQDLAFLKVSRRFFFSFQAHVKYLKTGKNSTKNLIARITLQ